MATYQNTRLELVQADFPPYLQLFTGGGIDYIGFNVSDTIFFCIVKSPNDDAIPTQPEESCYIVKVDTESLHPSKLPSVQFDSLTDAIYILDQLKQGNERKVLKHIGRSKASRLIDLTPPIPLPVKVEKPQIWALSITEINHDEPSISIHDTQEDAQKELLSFLIDVYSQSNPPFEIDALDMESLTDAFSNEIVAHIVQVS